jgi:hypothetical protein
MDQKSHDEVGMRRSPDPLKVVGSSRLLNVVVGEHGSVLIFAPEIDQHKITDATDGVNEQECSPGNSILRQNDPGD